VEKPQPGETASNLINAGVYVLEPEVLELVQPGRMVSVEREVFPRLVAQGRCYALADDAYWLDVGTPASYLEANLHELERRSGSWIGPGAEVAGAKLTRAAVGPAAVVEAGAVLEDAVVHERARIGAGAVVRRAIVGAGAVVAPGALVEDLKVVGPGAHVGDAA
jgi:mannose-1-phosphate guanylyltransferase